ncbi:Uncharacterised protein (plasmid) [Legionella adelaidensis]|uniref:Uncharacterized protein n=1 Tax=Legionella adelaidensis TaxID=45056 RepID=A0A0W0R504_9GAMM|nr:hypothetical protein [Legionella adelaidensis]KTC66147.1 hypothetical protein Lade_0805 [Legionella adelaidensis]VEH85659.1 Uncharacterised protein [Legionella adelaidensis]
MKKLAGIFAFLTVSTAYAIDFPPQAPLDTIGFQISAKQWVTTRSALLTITINATLNNADLVKARGEIMDKLNGIAKGDWHLVQFDRSQDTSGLEKLYVQAQARLDQGALTDIYQQAKNVSKPGATYEIASIDFKPSLEEMQQVRAQLREKLYQQVQEEINKMNKVYTSQNYSLNNLIFVDGNGPVTPQPKTYQAREMVNTMALAADAAPPLAVSNEMTLTAIAQAASNRAIPGNS